MLPLERLRLKDVLQTVCVLESVILHSFGPEGGQVLFTRDTGQAMLSRSGTHVLTALHLQNPVARFVVECVRKHSAATGDGSKTFILLLASLLRMIHAAASKEPHSSQSYNSREAAETASARCLADKLLAFASRELDDIIITEVLPYGCCVSWDDFTAKTQSSNQTNNLYVQTLLASFFHTRLSHLHCDFMSNLLFDFLNCWKFKKRLPSFSVQYLNDKFPALHTPVSGFPVSASHLIDGQVIHRDFATPVPHNYQQPVKAVVVTGWLQSKILDQGEILDLGAAGAVEDNSILHFNTWNERSLECIIAKLRTLRVSLLLCAVKQSAATLALATQAQICVVECVSEDELSVFAQLSGATPVSDCWIIGPEHVATLSFCKPIQLGAHRYVHVAFHDSEEMIKVSPCSLVLCGPGEEQTNQYTSAFRDAICMLLTTCEPLPLTVNTTSRRKLTSVFGRSEHEDRQTDSSSTISHHKQVLETGCVMPAGGTFEFVLHHALRKHSHDCSISVSAETPIAVSQLLANALLSIPRQIYSHSRRGFLETQTRVIGFLLNHSHLLGLMPKHERNTSSAHRDESKPSSHCSGADDVPSEDSTLDLGLESVSCKYQLLLNVLQCLAGLLRVDAILHTPHSHSRTLTHTSWEDPEDEDEI
ncbi:BBSome complex assembly protein BBS10 [Salarias fasciatus]|uniref:Bardet-Biedl syndrome 10 n=1 Tax=Salarias fasciatus TaxID=181472 RepID=A0A672IKY8_SALFA|nr:Bardet-Biedl syndrome 10 protein [Salarias fasciatus]